MLATAGEIWAAMLIGDDARRDSAISAIIAQGKTSKEVRALIMQRSAKVAAHYYGTPKGDAKLADWRALEGEPFLTI